MRYSKFSYHSSQANRILKPVDSKLDKNIKGIELEVDNVNRDGKDRLNEAIEDGVIISYDTFHMRKHDYNAVICSDGSVYAEVILQANQERNLLKKIKQLNDYGLNVNYFNNSKGTSCHIHNNMQYIENMGGNLLEMQRATEFLIPLIYKISGRDKDSYSWCHSLFDSRDRFAPDMNLLETARNADRLEGYNDWSHDIACNGQHSDTVEIRLFSNYYNFDYDMIKTYIEFTDHIIDIACHMKNKSYVDEYDVLIEWITDFCNGTRRRKKSLQQFHLNDLLVNREDVAIIELNNRWNNLYRIMENLERSTEPMNLQVRNVLRLVRDCNAQCDIQLQFNAPLYTYKVDLDSIRTEMNRQYNIERENL